MCLGCSGGAIFASQKALDEKWKGFFLCISAFAIGCGLLGMGWAYYYAWESFHKNGSYLPVIVLILNICIIFALFILVSKQKILFSSKDSLVKNNIQSYWTFLIQAVTRRRDFIENAETNFQGQWILRAMRMSYNMVCYILTKVGVGYYGTVVP